MALANVLRALADLAPSGREVDEVSVDVAASDQPFLWLGLERRLRPLLWPDPEAAKAVPTLTDPLGSLALRVRETPTIPKSKQARRLAGYDALHREQRLLRCGYLFLCGRAEVDGRPRRVCLPLVTQPVALTERPFDVRVEPIGELAMLGRATPGALPPWDFGFGPDPTPKRLFELRTLRLWVNHRVQAAGFSRVADVVGPEVRPEEAKMRADLVVVAGFGVYVDRLAAPTPRASVLLDWAQVPDIDDTALAHLYGVAGKASAAISAPRVDVDAAAAVDVPSPLALTAAQADVVERSRRQPVTVVSGAPGNGKSHAVCAVAIDAVARGQTVLVATPTPYAADVLGELLARQPGPQPVFFGETEGRRAMLAILESLSHRTAHDTELRDRRAVARRAGETRAAAEAIVVEALERELGASRAGRWTERLPELRAAAPGVFAAGADLDEVRRRLDLVAERASWFRRRRLRKLVGAAPIVGVEAIADAVEACADVRAEVAVDARGGTTIGPAWDALLRAEAEEAAADGALVDALARANERWDADIGFLHADGKGRRAVAALVRALPASRTTRRDLLADIDARALVRALPLWVGTLRDAEDLLPARAGLFDLVIVDEAAQVDQFRAAGTLLRARRAVIVGDPHQLRHVSFVADADVADRLDEHAVSDLADRLDVRRQSLYDVAAGAGPVTFLDEHFRSVPHLIEFSSRRFYGGRVQVATRHPSNEDDDVIDTVRVPDVAAEVDAVIDLLAGAVRSGAGSVGVYTPFRAHADAIEAAVLDRFDPEVLERHGIRTGTAHSAQGSERDHVVLALGLAVGDPPARWRFAEDPNLFNVLVTRARRRVTVVTALPADATPRGIIADYLRHAEHPPPPPDVGPPPSPWAEALAAELARNGVPTRVGYPVGRWTVDVCVGGGDGAVALDCGVHPDGPDAHLARHRALRRAGWRVVDAFASRWDGDAAAAAVELTTGFRGGGERP